METFIHPSAVIAENVTIGKGVYIGAGCVIGLPAENKDTFPSKGKGVIIRSGTILTGMVSIDSGVEFRTEIGKGCYLMKHSHVGHDAKLADGVTLSCGAKIGGHSIIGRGVNFGLNATCHQFSVVPEWCMIGANAFVNNSQILNPFRKYVGAPVRDIGENTYPIEKGLV